MDTVAAGKGIQLFIPQLYDIVWSLIILLILAVFFYKFFMPKFQAIFDERSAKIEGNIQKAKKARDEADQAKKDYEDQLNKARVEASQIRDDARAEASRIVADARSRAETEANQITESAQRSLQSQRQQALVSLKGEVGTLATALAGKILSTQLQDNAVQSTMIDSLIKDVGESQQNERKV